jgi:hypothetical protein
MKLVSVVREDLKKGYKFTGTYEDGTVLVLRAKATRPYTYAAVHSAGVTTKFFYDGVNILDHNDPRKFITFHSSPNPSPSYKGDTITSVIPITH